MRYGLKPTTLKCDLPTSSHVFSSSVRYPCSWLPSRQSSTVKSTDNVFNVARLSLFSIVPDGEIIDQEDSKMQFIPSALQAFHDGHLQERMMEKTKTASPGRMCGVVEEAIRSSQFGLLLENLDILEEYVADSNSMKLERDILLQLRRLGALELFKTCLSKSLGKSISNTGSIIITEDIKPYNIEEHRDCTSNVSSEVDHEKRQRYFNEENVIIRTRKKQQRLSISDRIAKRQRVPLPLSCPSHKTARNESRQGYQRVSKSKGDIVKFAKREAEISRGVKAIAELEKLWTILEKETGQAPTLNSWAEASKLDKQTLQQQLRFGWYCRDELIKSTSTLILFLAKGYKGFGIAVEDLLQAGYIGVLQGAERFDHTKGYRFSTYARYWILRSISKTVSQTTRGIELPSSLNRAVRKITSARKILRSAQGKEPTDKEIADFTGLTVASVEAASKYPTYVASLDQKLGDLFNATYMEFIPDVSIQGPQEAVARQHIKQVIHEILNNLESREREVLLLRFGFGDHRPRSLEEIGRVFHVSKEWVRRLEKKVLTKIFQQNGSDLIHFTTL